MQLSRVLGYHINIPFRIEISHSLFRRTATEALIVVVEDSNGLRGYGEGTPRSYVTGETLEGSAGALAELSPALLDKGIWSSKDIIAILAEIGASKTARRAPSCWCALETAALDLYGKDKKMPLWQLFAQEPVSHDFVYSAVLPLVPDCKSLVNLARTAAKNRMRFVKVKVAERKAGIETLQVLRSELGAGVDLRVDANGAFSAREALLFLDEADQLGISALEQPVPKGDFAALGEVTRLSRVPVVVDESLCSLEDANYLVENKLCTGFNIRLSKCGGILKSLAIFRLAKEQDFLCQLGCHVGETAILSAAGRHVAALCGGLAYLEGSFSQYILEEDLSQEDISFGLAGVAPLLSGPGLGLTINDAALSKWGVPMSVA